MYREANPNPDKLLVGDCVVRAISIFLGTSWEKTYMNLAVKGLQMHDMPSANRVWERFLHERGFRRHELKNTCPECYTVKDFCKDRPQGKYILASGTHLVTVIKGNYYDAWDSGMVVPETYWS